MCLEYLFTFPYIVETWRFREAINTIHTEVCHTSFSSPHKSLQLQVCSMLLILLSLSLESNCAILLEMLAYHSLLVQWTTHRLCCSADHALCRKLLADHPVLAKNWSAVAGLLGTCSSLLSTLVKNMDANNHRRLLSVAYWHIKCNKAESVLGKAEKNVRLASRLHGRPRSCPWHW